MSLADFLASPWDKSHEAYDASPINMRPAPEFATAEVIVASTYRAAGFSGHAEKSVSAAGSRFDKDAAKPERNPASTSISADTWRTILHGALESPKQPNQSARRFLQLCPVVPDVALYSGSARISGNSWNPGQLVKRIIRLGSESEEAAKSLWAELHKTLSVNGNDDIWARWLQSEFERRRTINVRWTLGDLKDTATLNDADKSGLRIPARQLVKDLAVMLLAKPCMTRRQWISLMESVLRLGTVAHVLWLCDVNDRLWQLAREVLGGTDVPGQGHIRREVIANTRPYLMHGAQAVPIVRDFASRYLVARLGINILLWHLHEADVEIERLSSTEDIIAFLNAVASRREELQAAGVLSRVAELRDSHARTLACKRGIGSNIVEFARHTLGQRQTADQNLRGYDQGYQLKKRAEYAAAPWIVSLGPAAVLAFVHCCLAEAAGPRSVHRLCEHLAWYGVDVDIDDIAKSDLGKKLRMLGLVLDSPDAESGMLLVPPFELTQTSSARQPQ